MKKSVIDDYPGRSDHNAMLRNFLHLPGRGGRKQRSFASGTEIYAGKRFVLCTAGRLSRT